MSSSSIPARLPDRTEIPGEPDGLILYERVKTSADDNAFFAFMNALRTSVEARVASERKLGRPLSEIIVEVREMTLLAERELAHPKPFSAHTFRAIAKQAIAWSVEAHAHDERRTIGALKAISSDVSRQLRKAKTQ